MAERGLLQTIQRGQGLLHNPDLLMQQLMQQGLLAPAGASRSDPYHPVGGKRALSKTIGEMESKSVPHGEIKRRRLISPEEVQGGYMIAFPGDRTMGGRKVTNVGGVEVDAPQWGGGPYMRTPGGIWAAEQPQTKAISNKVERLSQSGKPVYGTHATMSARSLDFQHGMTNQILDALPQYPLTRAAKTAFNERYRRGYVGDDGERVTFPKFPGLDSPNLRKWVTETGDRRRWLAQAMDKTEFEKLGFPNIPEMRVAATEKAQLHLPMYASGAEIARLQPGVLTGSGNHPSFPAENVGTYRGGFGTYLPVQTGFPDFYAANVAGAKPGSNWQRSFQWNYPTQELNQQWVDQAMPVWNLLRGAK